MRGPLDQIRMDIRGVLAMLAGNAVFTDQQDVFETGIVRSLNLLELIVAVEDRYGIEITERDMFAGHLRSVERLVAFVVERTSRAKSALCAEGAS